MRFALAMAASILVAVPAVAATHPQRSTFTTLDRKECKSFKAGRDGMAWRCSGLSGVPVYIIESDRRTYVSLGADGEKRRAATQSLEAANTIFVGKSLRATIEWRIVYRDGKPVPYASIMRFFTTSGEMRGEVLVVSRVGVTDACHIAYVDALANPDAILLARDIADRRARTFDCSKEPVVEGNSGKSPL